MVFMIFCLSMNVFLQIVFTAIQFCTGDGHDHRTIFHKCYQGDATTKVLSLNYFASYGDCIINLTHTFTENRNTHEAITIGSCVNPLVNHKHFTIILNIEPTVP